MTVEEFKADCKAFGIAQFKACVEQFNAGKKEILYVAQTPYGHNYGGYQRNTTRCFVWREAEGWSVWFANLSNHRAGVALRARAEGKLESIEPVVLNNYLTNGYSTRRGLFAKYSEKQLERMGKIAMSHADYLGNEIDSTTDHYNRVAMRNE